MSNNTIENYGIEIEELPFEQRPLPAAHNIVAKDWFKKMGREAYTYWLELLTMIDEEKDKKKGQGNIKDNLTALAKYFGFKSQNTLKKNVIEPLWNYGFIDLYEYSQPGKEHLKTQKSINIRVYKAPLNNAENSLKPLKKIRDYKADYTSDAKKYALDYLEKKEITKRTYEIKEATNVDLDTLQKNDGAWLSVFQTKNETNFENVDLDTPQNFEGYESNFSQEATNVDLDTPQNFDNNIYTNNILSKNTFELNSLGLDLNSLGLEFKTQQQQKDNYIAIENEQVKLEILKTQCEVPELIAKNTIKLLAKRDLLGQATPRALLVGGLKAMEALKHTPKDVPHTFIAKYIENEIGAAALPAPSEPIEQQEQQQEPRPNFAQSFKDFLEA